MRPPFLPVLAVAVAAAAAAQVRVDPASNEGRRLAEAFDREWSRKDASRLPCQMTRYQPQLDYGLRLWAGYGASLSAAELTGRPDERMAVTFRITPQNRSSPVYFYQNVPVPPLPAGASPGKVRLEIGGGFLLGEGRYRVDWMLMHTSQRVCRSSWNLKARARGAMLPPGQAEAVDAALWHGFDPSAGGGRAAIFLHASPVRPRRYVTHLSPWDRQILLSTVSSVLREGGFRSASLTVVDLQHRRTVFHADDIDPRGLRRLARQLTQVDYGAISLETLAQGSSPRGFLEELLKAELMAPQPQRASALVFIGSRWRGGPKLDGLSPALKESAPKSWLLAFSTPQTLSEPDSLSSLVKSLGGKVFSIYRPQDLAAALRELAAGRTPRTP